MCRTGQQLLSTVLLLTLLATLGKCQQLLARSSIKEDVALPGRNLQLYICYYNSKAMITMMSSENQESRQLDNVTSVWYQRLKSSEDSPGSSSSLRLIWIHTLWQQLQWPSQIQRSWRSCFQGDLRRIHIQIQVWTCSETFSEYSWFNCNVHLWKLARGES